jgi:hypothetical protein|tara:strand:+ start:2715 stop:3569 length:855 start_codon:yes stop_codon:yes gene_type:complete
MKKILTAVLTSEDSSKLDRCLRTLESQTDTLVVCNTTDEQYPKEAEKIASKYSAKFIQTESNGKLGKGKNSVLEHFSRTDMDFLFLVDGDDFVYPNTLETVNFIVDKIGDEFDIMALTESEVWTGKELMRMRDWPESDHFRMKITPKIAQLAPTEIMSLLEASKIGRELTDDNSALHRVILYSKKAANEFRWSEEDDIADNPGFLDLVIQFDDRVKYTNAKGLYIYDQSETQSAGVYFETLRNQSKYVWKNEYKCLTKQKNLDIIEVIEKLTYDERIKYIKENS